MALFVSGKLFNKANVGEGGGGSDQHNLGWYATESALTTAHPTATDGDWVIIGSTDTVWVWDTDTTAWKDTGAAGIELPDQTGNAGKFLTTNGTSASWSDTVTGLKVVNSSDNTKYTTVSSTGNLLIQDGPYWRRTQLVKSYNPKQINFILVTDETNTAATIGSSNNKIDFVYTTKINNGGDIAVPNVNGEMAVKQVSTTITLTSAGWSSNTQTVNVTGMTATGLVFVSPTPTDQSAYTSAGIICSAQAAGTLTFTCTSVPSGNISVSVVML